MTQIYKVNEQFDHSFFAGTSCAFGVFDGVHAGHRYLLDCARETARKTRNLSVALTFDRDPDEVFHPRRLKKLMTNESRLAMLAKTGVDAVVVLPFTHAFSTLPPKEFLYTTFNGTVPAFLHVGCDFKFGAHAAGSVHELSTWGEHSNTHINAHHLKTVDGEPITATRIRLLLQDGHIEQANCLLTRAYFLEGTVERGRGQGADMGFRTANLTVPEQLRALGDGVYAAWAVVGKRRFKAAVNMGVAPTFAHSATASCEVHLLDFQGDLYGKPIRVEFIHWLRAMKKFEHIDELIATVKSNITWVRENL